MNKIQEITTFIEKELIDIAFISESHDRENKKLEDNIQLPNHTVISNIYQRSEKGGRPAIIANKEKYTIDDLINTSINIPWGGGNYLGPTHFKRHIKRQHDKKNSFSFPCDFV